MGSERDRLTVIQGGEEAAARALESLSDEALLAIIATPDGDLALAELYDRYGKIAYGLAYRVLRDSTLAEDAVQEAFITVWRTAGTYIRERGKPRTWLLTLVHRRAVDLVRREQRRRVPPAADEPAPATPAAEDEATLRDRRRAVQAALDAAAGRPARGARARLLRRPDADRARGAARRAARHDQEPDVRRAYAGSETCSGKQASSPSSSCNGLRAALPPEARR